MDIVTHAQLRALVEAGSPPCVSIFMPTHRAGRDVRQDPVHLKNLLKTAEEGLEAHGMRPTEALDFLEPARRLLDDPDFWTHGEGGLAIYIAKGFFRGYRIPVEVDDIATVNDRFDIKPLVPLLQTQIFYILALSRKDVRLLECTPRTVRRLELPEDLPRSVAEANPEAEEEHQTHLMRHSSAAAGPQGAGSYHGQAVDIQARQHEDEMQFYRAVDAGILKTIRDTDAPLILAGAETTTPFYRQASGHKHIHSEFIHGNPEHVPDDTLHQKAATLMEPLWHDKLNAAQERFGTALAQGIASRELTDIVGATLQGRVDTLFVDPSRRVYGRVNEETLTAESAGSEDPSDGEEDLIARATTQTLLTSGVVVPVTTEQMPGNGALAAIYRY